MDFEFKYNILLWKSYFDKGLGLTNYVKYLIAFFGLTSRNVNMIMTIAIIYVIFCFILGYFFIKYEWFKAEQEIANRYNLFVKEMRESYSVKRKTLNSR